MPGHMLKAALVFILVSRAAFCTDDIEREPIEYSKSTPENRVSQLQARIARGEVTLEYTKGMGYLPSVLKALQIPPESQTLVFSKTSLQRHRIAPRTPRAIYFNDDTYVGYCQSGDVMEISVADPMLGGVFYTIDQSRLTAATFERHTENCLQCHATTQTDGIPGHVLRSVFVDAGGLPLLAEGSRRVDHTTPIEDRWGGWYVTGTHGTQTHLGNLIIRESRVSRPVKNENGQNVTDLSKLFPVGNYLTPYSDIVALMVLEHQVLVHNLIAKANYATRQALHYESEINRALGEPEGQRRDSTVSRIKNAGDRLVEGLLFVNEAHTAAKISGISGFAEVFPAAGPRDQKGRSLRDLDLSKRLFRYPCSYLIYCSAFDGLPDAMKSYVAGRLHEILSGTDTSKPFEHLSHDDRQAILEILLETKPDLWKKPAPADDSAD